MFPAIKKKVENLKKFNQEKELNQILTSPSLKAQIIDLNQKQLYEEGKQADGTGTGEYAYNTIHIYKPLAIADGRDGRSDHVTFKDTGATYRSMEVEAAPDGIIITADDPYGVFEFMDAPQALGLTSESKSEILPEIRSELVDRVRKRLHG